MRCQRHHCTCFSTLVPCQFILGFFLLRQTYSLQPPASRMHPQGRVSCSPPRVVMQAAASNFSSWQFGTMPLHATSHLYKSRRTAHSRRMSFDRFDFETCYKVAAFIVDCCCWQRVGRTGRNADHVHFSKATSQNSLPTNSRRGTWHIRRHLASYLASGSKFLHLRVCLPPWRPRDGPTSVPVARPRPPACQTLPIPGRHIKAAEPVDGTRASSRECPQTSRGCVHQPPLLGSRVSLVPCFAHLRGLLGVDPYFALPHHQLSAACWACPVAPLHTRPALR